MHHTSVQKNGIAGLVTIHSAPVALRQHIEWGLNSILGAPAHFSWREQPLLVGTIRTVLEFRAPSGTSAKIATALKNWHYLRFEVQEMSDIGGDYFRFTPELGIHRAQIDASGSILIGENVIRTSLATFDDLEVRENLELALGTAWESALEPMRGVDLQEVAKLRAI
jgi:hypothetical protein